MSCRSALSGFPFLASAVREFAALILK